MDVIAEILPSSYLAKSENTAKDRKNKPAAEQKKQQAKQTGKQDAEELTNTNVTAIDAWDQQERRSGQDRRQQRKSRGRWLDSRTSPDRRKENTKQVLQIRI